MNIVFIDESWEDYLHWQRSDWKMVVKINNLLKDISRHPFRGLGKPEPLKHRHKGYWARRIDREHRLIYKVSNKHILFAKCRFHYD